MKKINLNSCRLTGVQKTRKNGGSGRCPDSCKINRFWEHGLESFQKYGVFSSSFSQDQGESLVISQFPGDQDENFEG
jgi:hypothetical protein